MGVRVEGMLAGAVVRVDGGDAVRGGRAEEGHGDDDGCVG